MLLQRTQGGNSEPAHVRKLDHLGFPGLFFCLARGNGLHQAEYIEGFPCFIDLTTLLVTFPDKAFATVQHKKREGPSAFLAAASLPETLFQYVGAP